MTRISFGLAFLAVILTNSPVKAQAQDSVAIWSENTFHYLRDSAENDLGMGCGYMGAGNSETVGYFLYLLNENQFHYIKELAYSEIPATQFLAVLAIDYLEDADKIKPDTALSRRIKQIKSSKATFETCRGCVLFESDKLKSLFHFGGNRYYYTKKIKNLIREYAQ